jgi:hypothetical protein
MIGKNVSLVVLFVLCSQLAVFAQPDRWQQRIKYNMDVNLNVNTNIVAGKQKITYTNNSPDTLKEVFIHLYWNAFQPNSSMDVRSRELGETVLGKNRDGSDRRDWDDRVKDRISKLQANEIGYCKVKSISLNGKTQKTTLFETILKVELTSPILPKSTVVFQTDFECQVPVQIRRSGRNNAQGIGFSMTQWYPKMVEYDYTGWNANPYIAREFYGVWGDYDVNITLNKDYKIGASGVLQNATEIGWGYDKEGTPLKSISAANRTWKFRAENVHDFAWAADTAYKHITRKTANGPLLHFIYKQVDSVETGWQRNADTCAMAYPFIAKHFGAYPWPVYSFIQGGDGGMEYAMATLIKSHSLGTMLHEWMHSWYQQLMGTNESLYSWMDEGFTTYAEGRVSQWLRKKPAFAQEGSYRGYYGLANSRREEPMTTHADHYNSNYAYSNDAYSKGAVFLSQLGYIISDSLLDKTLLEYYRLWKFKHPNPTDFIRVAEIVSGIQLKWYHQDWINSTKTIDYKIDSLWSDGQQTNIRIKRIGDIAMPIDVQLTFKDSTQELHYVPRGEMYNIKPVEHNIPRTVYAPQPWTHREMVISTTKPLSDIIGVEIDPSLRLADVDRKNNKLDLKW